MCFCVCVCVWFHSTFNDCHCGSNVSFSLLYLLGEQRNFAFINPQWKTTTESKERERERRESSFQIFWQAAYQQKKIRTVEGVAATYSGPPLPVYVY